jgi:hypothetical protein
MTREEEELLKAFEEMSDEELSQLPPEDLEFIQGLAEAPPTGEEVLQQQIAENKIPDQQIAYGMQMGAESAEAIMGIPTEEGGDPTQQILATGESGLAPDEEMQGQALGGFLSAAQGIPGVKQVAAASEVVQQAISNPEEFALSELGAQYSNARKEQEESFKQAKEENPWANVAGEVGGAFMGVGALGKIGFATKGLKAAFTTTPTLTAIQAYNRDPDLTLQDMSLWKEMGTATALDALLFGTGRAFKAIGSTAKTTAQATPTEAIAARQGDIKNIVDHVRKTSLNLPNTTPQMRHQAYKQSLVRFNKSLRNGNTPILAYGLEPEEMLQRAITRQKEVGQEIGQTLNLIDDKVDNLVDIKEVERKISNDIIEPLMTSDSTKKQQLGTKLLGRIKDDLYDTVEQTTKKVLPDGTVETVTNLTRNPKKMSLKRLHKYYNDLSSEAVFEKGVVPSQSEATLAKQYSKVSGLLSDHIEDLVERAAPKLDDPLLLANFQAKKLEFRDVLQASNALANTANDANASAGIGKLLSDMVSLKGFVTGSAVGMSIGNKAAIGGISLTINALRTAKSLPATLGTAAVGVADFLEKASMSPEAQNIVRRLTTAATIGAVDFEKELAVQSARVSLLQKPMGRTVESVKENAAKIAFMLDDMSPEYADQFLDVIENGEDDDIAAFMSEMVKMPQAKGLVEEGFGFNGKLYDQGEKDYYINEVKNSRYLPKVQRLRLQKQIQDDGYIPQNEDLLDQRQPRPFVPRRKDKLRY